MFSFDAKHAWVDCQEIRNTPQHQYRICVMPVKGLFSKAGNTMIRDTGIIAVASIIVAVTVIFKERAIASRFGVGDVTDAFALASATVVFLATVFGGSLALSLIPALMRVEIESGQTVAEELCRAVLAYLLLGMVTIATAIYVFSEPIISVIGGSFSSEKQKLTGDLLVVMLPLLPLGGWAAYVTALLNARGGFFISTTAQAAIPLAVVIVLYIAPTPYALVGGLVLGYFAQCLVLAVALRNQGRWLLPQWRAPRNDMKAVWGQYLPVTIGAAFMGSTVVTDQVMAGWLAPGSVATLAFASVLVNYLNAFGGRLLGAPALTHFAKLTAQKKWAEASHLMWQATFITGGVAFSLTVIVWFFSDWLVAQLFEGDAFTHLDTVRVAEVQKYFALQLIFQFVGVLQVRMLSALGRNRVILAVAAFNFLSNIALNYLLMVPLGVAGIALSTSIVLCISALLCGAVVWRSLSVTSYGKRRL